MVLSLELNGSIPVWYSISVRRRSFLRALAEIQLFHLHSISIICELSGNFDACIVSGQGNQEVNLEKKNKLAMTWCILKTSKKR